MAETVRVYLSNDDNSGKTIRFTSLRPSFISRLYNLDPSSILLEDKDNIVCEQSQDDTFLDIAVYQSPFTVTGLGTGTINTLQVAHPAPQFGAPPAASQFGAPPAAPQFGAPPAAPQFGVPVAPRTGVPPPGVVNRRRSAAIVQQHVDLKFRQSERAKKTNRPGRIIDSQWLRITEAESNVTTINAKIQSLTGYQNHVICDADGMPIPDNDITKEPSFWGFGKPPQSQNAKKYHAMLPITNQEDSDSDEGPTSRKRARINPRDIEKIKNSVNKEAVELAKMVTDLFTCSMCDDVAILSPVVCVSCKVVIACQACANRWVLTSDEHGGDNHDKCPKCKGQWAQGRNADESIKLDRVPLTGFENMLRFAKKIVNSNERINQ